MQAKTSGNYTFYTTSDDGVRLWVNGVQLINNWTNHSASTNQGNITLTAGAKYDITMEYFENGVDAVASLSWSTNGTSKQIIPQQYLYSTASTPTPPDTEAPTAPTNLASPSKTDTSMSLSWSASSDNVGVSAYDVYRNNVLLGSTDGSTTSFNDTGLTGSTQYSYTVKARDAAGNVSPASTALLVTTNATPAPPPPGTGTGTARRIFRQRGPDQSQGYARRSINLLQLVSRARLIRRWV